MNIRHVDFDFRSNRTISLLHAKLVFRSFHLEFYGFFRSSLKEQFSNLTLAILGEIHLYHIMVFISLLQILLAVKEHQHIQSQTSVSYLEEKQILLLSRNQPLNLII